jgi:hypothetical protein
MTGPDARERRDDLAVAPSSVLVLLSTDGSAATTGAPASRIVV